MKVHLVDGTYELFRFHFAKFNRDSRHGAQRGVLKTILDLVDGGATHIGIATDHVIESFRNELLDSYKDGSGVDPDLLAQFVEVEELLSAAGFEVWPQCYFEADDGLAAGAALGEQDPNVEQVLICTPDKDLAQCVTEDGRVVQLDRRREIVYDYDGVIEKFGVPPESIPDYLALVGDSADGFAGIPGWGAKSASTVLARYGHIEEIPSSEGDWDVTVRGAEGLCENLQSRMEEALLYRHIATVDTSAPVSSSIDKMRWTGPSEALEKMCRAINAEALAERAHRLAELANC